MLNSDIKSHEKIINATSEGHIDSDEIKSFARQVNDYINETDQVPSLVLFVKSVADRADFNTLKNHLEFVRDHHAPVRKVAIISYSNLLWLAKSVVDHFVSAKVRRFNEDAIDDAIAWAQIEKDHAGVILGMHGLPEDVIGIDIRGLVPSQDYTNMLIPLVTQREKEHRKPKMISVLGTYFGRYSPGAMCDDMRDGFSHLTTFRELRWSLIWSGSETPQIFRYADANRRYGF